MITALRTAASGLVAQSAKQDIIANNIANAQTAGYKRVRTTATSFSQALQQALPSSKTDPALPYPRSRASATLVGVDAAIDTSEGPIMETGNDLDLAISGPGCFEAVSPTGQKLTRAGNLRLGAEGVLLTTDGASVQGRSGTIHLPKGRIEINSEGVISVDGAEVDKIKIVGEEAGVTRVIQSHLEGANVNIISEMVSMIANMRAFEANQKVITSVDQTLDTLISQAGRV
jgi:flagellar basal-body rod protein FlgF